MADLSKYMLVIALFFLFITVHCKDDDDQNDEKPGEAAGVTYDGRSLLINGKRELLFSGSVHYPRVPLAMWEDILDKCKEGGLNVIQTYVFWNVHEPVKGQYNFTGNYDLVKFVKMAAERGMWVTLRVGPFIQAEWNHGGLPYWLRREPKIIYRTNNAAYKEHMEKWVTKVINLMKDHKLFAPQGGPIILSQIENEYDHVREAFDEDADKYIKWAGDMAIGLKTGVPWLMCKQKDAPGEVINACNGRHCGDTFTGPNSPNKPSLWTENWTAQYRVFGDAPSQRAAEDIAFSVARWFSRNGSHVNYYMYYGGTNYGRTSASFVTTRYYDEAPLDEFGLLREPKYGHLRDLHRALVLSKKALIGGNYGVEKINPDLEVSYYEKGDLCAAFIWNNCTHKSQTAKFRGLEHIIPPKSISILPDCKTVIYNTDHIVAQHSSREFLKSETAHKNLKWEKTQEHIPTKSTFFTRAPTEQYDAVRDTTDYMWYSTSIELDSVDLPFKKSLQPVLQILSLGHALLAYVNGEFVGTGHGVKRETNFAFQVAVRFKEGWNNISVLSNTVGMPDSGSYMEKRWTGIRTAEIQGLGTGNLDLTLNGWHHTIGLEGERLQYFTEQGAKKARWSPAQGAGEPLTWYKATFDAPEGDDPLAIRMENMTKGMVYVNGQSIGRFWSSCLTVLKKPSQNEYHIPRSFLKPKDNFLVIFDEAGGNIDSVQIETVNRNAICSLISEDMPADVRSWKRDGKEIKPVGETPQPKASLKCHKDKVITHIDFASFGNPYGVCGYFLLGNCTAPNSQKVVEQLCLGKDSCIIPVDKNTFDTSACPEVATKKLAVQVRCGRKD